MASNVSPANSARKCLCSPTNHSGSFRCNLHRETSSFSGAQSGGGKPAKISTGQIQSQWKKMSPSAKEKSLKAFLFQIIKPSSHDVQRRRDFRPKPSRFFIQHASDSIYVS